MVFGCLSGGNSLLKKSLKECEDKVLSLQTEINDLNKQLSALKEKHIDMEMLEQQNNEYKAKIGVLEATNDQYREENKKVLSIQLENGEKYNDKTQKHEILQMENERLVLALKNEKEKAKKRRKEASERRARFKEKVQHLTRKLSDELEDETKNDDAPKAANA